MSLIRAQEMELVLHTLIILELSWIANSFNVYEPARVPGWNYFGYSWMDQKPSYVFRKPMAAMVDLTNDLGVAILQDYSYSRSNFAFSPYGVASVLVVLYEGARGESARQIHRAVRFPWDKDITRIGFRDIHRHLRSYFSHEGYLSGITLSKDGSTLKPEYKQILRFYGYDVDVDTPEKTSEVPLITTQSMTSSPSPTTNSTTVGNELATIGGNDYTTGKDTEETKTAASTIKPEDITTSSSDETMSTLTTTEDRESHASPATGIASSSTTESGEAPVTESTEAAVTTETQNSVVGLEENTQETEVTSPKGGEKTTEQGTQQNIEQITPQDNKQDTQQEIEESTQGSNVQDGEQIELAEENTEQSDVKDTQQSTAEEDESQDTQQNTDVNISGGNGQDAEQVKQPTDSNPKGNNVQGEEENPVDNEPIEQQVTPTDVEYSTQGINPQGENPTSTDRNTEKVEPDIQGETDENTEESSQEYAQSSVANAESDSQQSTEETLPEDNQVNAESGTEMTPTVTSPIESSGLVTESTSESNEPVTMAEDVGITSSTNEAEEIAVSTPETIEEVLATLQEAEVVGNLTTEEGDRSSRSDALDNGMLIPQFTNGRYPYFDDGLGLAFSKPDKRNLIDDSVKRESTSEDWKEIGVALIAEGDEVKWEPKTLDEFLKNLMKSARESGDGANRTRRLASGKIGRRRQLGLDSTGLSPEETLLLTGGRKLGGSSNGKSLPVVVETSAKLKRRHSTKEKRNISEFLKVPPVTDLSLQLQNGMFDSHVSKDTDLYRALPKFLFLVDGAIDTPVPMMTYTNVFPFAYIPRLHCKALEFPLDDERYKLLILLPVERRGLRQLIYDLGSYPLREVIDVLRPARVKAMVPTFMVEGFVILTPTLQKMGIWDVFDPRRSDLSGMTSDPDLYVRNIEQSVTVVIRNYVEILDIQTRTMAARHIDEDFSASHPFLYFVMDTATNVALMAGQMLDPLNSRIY